MEDKRVLELLPAVYAVCQLGVDAPVPAWATCGAFFSATHTDAELSVICLEHQVPGTVRKEGGWRLLRVRGSLPFSLTGVVASLTSPMAIAGISVFALSTFETDYLLVKQERLLQAVRCWKAAGYGVIHERDALSPVGDSSEAGCELNGGEGCW